jgi:hypothetical protein
MREQWDCFFYYEHLVNALEMLWRCFDTVAGHGLSWLRDHTYWTQGHTHTCYDSCGRVISPTHEPLPDNTQNSQQTDIHVSGGNQIRNCSEPAAAEQLLRPRGHWDRPVKQTQSALCMSRLCIWPRFCHLWPYSLSNDHSMSLQYRLWATNRNKEQCRQTHTRMDKKPRKSLADINCKWTHINWISIFQESYNRQNKSHKNLHLNGTIYRIFSNLIRTRI